jgi:hypothetical protein
MKTLIMIVLAMFFIISCGDQDEPKTIYKYKYVYTECMKQMEEDCETYNCTEKQRSKYIEDFCVVDD